MKKIRRFLEFMKEEKWNRGRGGDFDSGRVDWSGYYF